jgi:hypothetical protein
MTGYYLELEMRIWEAVSGRKLAIYEVHVHAQKREQLLVLDPLVHLANHNHQVGNAKTQV